MTLWTSPSLDNTIEKHFFEFSQYRYNTPDICQTPFFTNHIRYEIDTRDVTGYSQFDFFELQGLSAVDASMVSWYGKAKWDVIYVPNKDASGLDSFTYSATDCPGNTHTLSIQPMIPSQCNIPIQFTPLICLLFTPHQQERLEWDSLNVGLRMWEPSTSTSSLSVRLRPRPRPRPHPSTHLITSSPDYVTPHTYSIFTPNAGTAGTAKIDPSKKPAKLDLSIWYVYVKNINATIHVHTLIYQLL